MGHMSCPEGKADPRRRRLSFRGIFVGAVASFCSRREKISCIADFPLNVRPAPRLSLAPLPIVVRVAAEPSGQGGPYPGSRAAAAARSSTVGWVRL